MTPKSWPCAYQCENPVSEIGAYVKLTSNKYAHLVCHNQAVSAATRVAVEQEQAAQRAERNKQEMEALEASQARERAREERRAEVAERERTNRIEAQRAMPLPPRVSAEREEAARRAIAEGKSVVLPAPGEVPERPKSRFELIEMDDELVEEKGMKDKLQEIFECRDDLAVRHKFDGQFTICKKKPTQQQWGRGTFAYEHECGKEDRCTVCFP